MSALSEVISLRRALLLQQKPANILMIGAQGAGTSSLTNAFFSALSDRIHTISLSVPGCNGTTKQYSARKLTSSVLLCETWGWTNQNYNRDELQLILQGRLRSGSVWKTKVNFDELYKGLVPANEAASRAADVALVVVSAAEKDFARTKAVLQQIRDHGVRVLIAVTHLDIENPSYQHAPHQADSAVEKVLTSLGSSLSVDRQHVWPVLPYVNEALCSSAIDAINLRCLSRVILMCQDVRAERQIEVTHGAS